MGDGHAGNLQAGAAGEMDRQRDSRGRTAGAWYRENRIPEKSYYYWQQLFEAVSQRHPFVQPTFAEITPSQAKRVAVPAVAVRCAGMEADIYNGADTAVMETVLHLLKSY